MLLKSLLLHNTLHIFEIECKVIKKKLNYQTFLVIFYISPMKTGKKAHIFFFLYDCKITLRLLHRIFTPITTSQSTYISKLKHKFFHASTRAYIILYIEFLQVQKL